MEYTVIYTNAFKADLKSAKKRGWSISLLEAVANDLRVGNELNKKYKEHILLGQYDGYHECHIKPDWLLLYYYFDNFLVFDRTGTHSDLF
ncbi:MAG: type II toxin-antitoxin system YafQ family toxin [Clostridiales bacterium]|jgi:mRNA interferase YafQ|nr:type II toxin-antitoxin system YafQ family toxin [Clostridiales bacterium]